MTEASLAPLYSERTKRDDWLPAALVAVVTGYAALTRPAAIRLSDLGVYVGAVDGLRHGASLYDFISAGNAPFTYPPFAGLLFWPLTAAPTLLLQVGWTLATLATVCWLARLMARSSTPSPSPSPPASLSPSLSPSPFLPSPFLPSPFLPSPFLPPPFLAPSLSRSAFSLAPVVMSASALGLALMLSAPISSDLRYGQVSAFLVALVAADVLVLRGSRFQGVLVGVAAAIKLTPLIFIPMLWCAGRRRAAATATATFAACGLAAAVVLPGDSWRFWTVEVSRVSRLGYITSAGNQSLNGALLRFDLPASLRTAIVLVIGGGIAAIALRRAARLGRHGDWVPALVVTGAASIVLSPVSWTHHQIWLVLAVLLPVGTGASQRARGVWIAVVLVVMVLPVTALGPPLWSNARLLLAIVIAALLPLRTARPSRSRSGASTHHLLRRIERPHRDRERQVADDPVDPAGSPCPR
jgi:alpha-1,2-mannosyltransferase